MTPPDAAVAVRSFPRRFRELLEAADNDSPGRARRTGPDGWSPADHAAGAATALDEVAALLRQVAVSDEPILEVPAAGGASPSGATLDGALAALEAASGNLATAIDSVKGKDWERMGRDAAGQAWSALDVARLGVHLGVHHLRAAARLLDDISKDADRPE